MNIFSYKASRTLKTECCLQLKVTLKTCKTCNLHQLHPIKLMFRNLMEAKTNYKYIWQSISMKTSMVLKQELQELKNSTFLFGFCLVGNMQFDGLPRCLTIPDNAMGFVYMPQISQIILPVFLKQNLRINKNKFPLCSMFPHARSYKGKF